MATWIEAFKVTIPHGSNATVPCQLSRDVRVDQISILFPNGSNGLLSIQVRLAQQQIIPVVTGEFLIATGETIDWPIDLDSTSPQWSVTGVNAGTFDHSVYLRFRCSEPPDNSPASPITFSQPVSPVSASAIMGA